jgi:hypothetical protein
MKLQEEFGSPIRTVGHSYQDKCYALNATGFLWKLKNNVKYPTSGEMIENVEV